jgi:Cu/Ag efflux protein CusF
MRTRISVLGSVVMATVVGLALASAVGAQPRAQEKVNVSVTGDITAIDAAARSITVKSAHDEGVTYVVEASATIMKGSAKLAFEDLATGWNVAMNGHDDGTTKSVTYIKVVKAP